MSNQNNPHDLRNVKQMANETDLYWKNGPGHSLPPGPCKYYNCLNLHSNIRQASLSLPEVTLWNHTHTCRIYRCNRSGNRARRRSTQEKYWDTENTNSPHRYSLPKEDKQQLENYLAKVDSLAVDIKAT